MKKTNPIILFLILSLSMQSCLIAVIGHSNQVKRAEETYTVENGAIPPEFGSNPAEIFLPIKAGRDSYDKFLLKALANYTGTYEIAIYARLDQEKYSNKEVYRYYFYYDTGRTETMRGQDGTETGITNTYEQFYVYDRLTDKKYATGAEFSHFATAMKIYITNLDQQRISNLPK